MAAKKVRCDECGNETSRPKSYQGRTLCPPCEGNASRAAAKDLQRRRRIQRAHTDRGRKIGKWR